jgi:hypothetical protein
MGYGLGAAICGVALPLAANGQGAFALPPGVAAEVVDLQGSGERKPAPDTSSVPAHARDDLSRGAFVRTGPASKMALVVADETQVRLAQHSTRSTVVPCQSLSLWRQLLSAYPADGIAAAFVNRIESLQTTSTAEWTGAAALNKL